MAPPTYEIVSPDLYFPGLSETEKVVQAALLRILKARDPSVKTLPYEKARMARKRSQWLYERRLRRSGLYGLIDEQRERVMSLARSGGQMAGPLTLHEVDEWSAEVHYRAPWMSELTAHLMHHMRHRVSVGKVGFSLMPLLIVGDTGNGKSTYAQTLADVAGVPVRGVDVAGGSSAFRIAGLEKGWGSAAEGIPVEMMLMNKIANPVIIVNEIDKAGEKIASMSGGVTSLTTALLQVLEPDTAKRFECPVHRVRFDLSQMNWILTANDLDRVPGPLRDRCHIFHMPLVTPDVAALMFDTLLRDFDADIDEDICRVVRDAVIDAAQHGHVSLRQIRRILTRIVASDPQILH
jgi:hypothetical protein